MASRKRKSREVIVPPPFKRTRQEDRENGKQGADSSRIDGEAIRSTIPTTLGHPLTERDPPDLLLTSQSQLRILPSVPISTAVQESNTTEDKLLSRIQEGISYIRDQQGKGEFARQATRFEISSISPSPALELLRQYGTLIYESGTHEVYELGIPRPAWVSEGAFPGVHDPQWWLNKTAAEIKAGPYADEADIKRAAANLKGLETKKNKRKAPTLQEKVTSKKLIEGKRRQKMGLKKWASDDEDAVYNEHDVTAVLEEDHKEDEDYTPTKRGVRPSPTSVSRTRAQSSMLTEMDSEEDASDKRREGRVAARIRTKPSTQPEVNHPGDVPIRRSGRRAAAKVSVSPAHAPASRQVRSSNQRGKEELKNSTSLRTRSD